MIDAISILITEDIFKSSTEILTFEMFILGAGRVEGVWVDQTLMTIYIKTNSIKISRIISKERGERKYSEWK